MKKTLIALVAMTIAACVVSGTPEDTWLLADQIYRDSNSEVVVQDDSTGTETQEEKEQETDGEVEVPSNPTYGDHNCRDNSDCSQECMVCDQFHQCVLAQPGTKGKGCYGKNQQCNSNGKCECIGNTAGEQCNVCKEGFTGENCDKCLPWHYGPNCLPCTCRADMGNVCNEGKDGNGKCSSCWQNGWGEDCQYTTSCVHGKVDQLYGGCKCDEGYTGRQCDIVKDCVNGWANNTDGKCQSCYKGFDLATNCETCNEHVVSVDGGQCNACEFAYASNYNDNTYFSGSCVQVCNPGNTRAMTDRAGCICKRPYTGYRCEAACREGDTVIPGLEAEVGVWYWSSYKDKNTHRLYNSSDDCRLKEISDKRTEGYDFDHRYDNAYNGFFVNSYEILVIAPLMYRTASTNPKGIPEYTWEEAQTICPNPFRLPTREELEAFAIELPEPYMWMGGESIYWTATEVEGNAGRVYVLNRYYQERKGYINVFETAPKTDKHVVACVTDYYKGR